MAVPKKRTGHSAQGKRRSNWKATKPSTAKCPNCGETVLAHTICTACGYYKGKVVSRKSPDFVEETAKKPAKKTTAKKSTKKSKEVKETVTTTEVVEETKVEEVKEEIEEKKTEE